jgi:hypothetical protein
VDPCNIVAAMSSMMDMTLIKILLTTVVFGSLGGLVSHFVNNEKPWAAPTVKAQWYRYPSWPQSMCIGTAGAIGFLFFIVAVGEITKFDEVIEKIRVISVSTIAGFGARSLLPKMVAPLEKQIAAVSEEAARALQTAKSATEQLEAQQKRVDFLELNTKLIEAAHQGAATERRREILAKAKDYIQRGGAECAIWVNLARVQRWDSADDAIQTLNNALREVEAGRVKKDGNYNIIFYNLACYHNQKFRDSENRSDWEAISKNLDTYFSHSENPTFEIEQISNDPDLRDILDTEDFKGLAAKHMKRRV